MSLWTSMCGRLAGVPRVERRRHVVQQLEGQHQRHTQNACGPARSRARADSHSQGLSQNGYGPTCPRHVELTPVKDQHNMPLESARRDCGRSVRIAILAKPPTSGGRTDRLVPYNLRQFASRNGTTKELPSDSYCLQYDRADRGPRTLALTEHGDTITTQR